MKRFTHKQPGPALLAVVILSLILVACQGQTTPDGITTGAAAPDFTLTAADGQEVTLADYEGRPVLLFFHMAMG